MLIGAQIQKNFQMKTTKKKRNKLKMSNGIQREKGRKKKKKKKKGGGGGGQRELVVVGKGCWRMRPVDGRKERADQQSVIWYWPHLVVLCCCALLFSCSSPPFVVCQPWTDPPTCCCPPLPEKRKEKNTHTHCPVSLVREFRQCTSVRRVATLIFVFFPPLPWG